MTFKKTLVKLRPATTGNRCEKDKASGNVSDTFFLYF